MLGSRILSGVKPGVAEVHSHCKGCCGLNLSQGSSKVQEGLGGGTAHWMMLQRRDKVNRGMKCSMKLMVTSCADIPTMQKRMEWMDDFIYFL